MTKVWPAVQRFYWKRLATEWRRANSSLRSTDLSYAAYVREAEKQGNHEEVENLHGEWSAVRQEDQDYVDRLATAYWRKKAARYHIPEPPYGRGLYWEEGWQGGYRLTVAGIDFIETRIYEKRKRRWEFWLSAIPALTGLIGVLIGLLAIWRHSN